MNIKKIIHEELTQALNEYLVDDKVDVNVNKFFNDPKIAKHMRSGEELFVQFHTRVLETIGRRYDWLDIAPSGFYGVPLTKEAITKAVDQHGRRVARPRMTVFSVSGNVLRISQYDMKRLEADVSKILVEYPGAHDQVRRWKDDIKKNFADFRENKPGRHFHFLKNLNQYLVNDMKNLDKMYLVLGYDAVYDDVGYVLVEDFPFQIAVVEPKSVHVKGLLNEENPIFTARENPNDEKKKE